MQIKRNQLFTQYMSTADTEITALAAGNNVIMTDDGNGNYNVEVGAVLVQKDWTNFDTIYKNEGAWEDLFLVGSLGTILSQEDWLLLSGGTRGSDAGIYSTTQQLSPHFSLSLEWSNQNLGYSNGYSLPVMAFETGENGENGFALVQSRSATHGYGMQLLCNGVMVYEVVGTAFNKEGFNTIQITYDGDWLYCGINETPVAVSQISSLGASILRPLKFANFSYNIALVNTTDHFSINGLYKNLTVTGLL